MPALRAELSAKLDATSLLTGFIGADGSGGALGGAMGTVTAIASPVGADDLAGIGSGTVDVSGLENVAGTVASAVTARLAELPGPGAALGSISGTLELLQLVNPAELTAQFEALKTRLGTEFDPAAQGGTLGAIMHFGNALSESPEGQRLLSLLRTLFARFGLPAIDTNSPLTEALPAIDGVARVLSGMMTLETVLSEAERLTTVMLEQAGNPALQQSIDGVRVAFDPAIGLEAVIRDSDLSTPEGRDRSLAAIAEFRARIDTMDARVSQAFGFGEATLVYLDLAAVQAETDAGLALVRSGDLEPAGRTIRRFVDSLSPVMNVNLGGAAASGLDGLITSVEAKVAEFGGAIRGFDLTPASEPLIQGLDAIVSVLDSVSNAIASVTNAIRDALNVVRNAVQALPFQQIAGAITALLAPVTTLIDTIRTLVARIESALATAAAATTTALGSVEGVVDAFKGQIDALFGEAQAVVAAVNIDAVIGAVADKVRAFADLLASASLTPYFDTAVDAIGTAADVIDAVPFALLPDSMKADVDAALQPIKEADASALQAEIEELLQITDGRFELLDDLRAAIATVGDAFRSLLEEIDRHNPRTELAALDATLNDVAAQVQALEPQIALEPVQEAIDTVKEAIAGLDIDSVLQPVRDAFAEIDALIDEYDPARLLEPVEREITAVRTAIIDSVGLDTWTTTVDDLRAQALALVDRVDPARLEPLIAEALSEALTLLDSAPGFKLGNHLGPLVAALLSGSGRRIQPGSLEPVLDWLGGASGSAALGARTTRVADAIARSRSTVTAADLDAVRSAVSSGLTRLNAIVAAKPASAGKDAVAAAIAGTDADAIIGDLTRNRARFVAALSVAAPGASALGRSGFAEVDVAAARFRTAMGSAGSLGTLGETILARFGLGGIEGGLPGIVRRVLAVAPPARVAAIISPIFAAIRDRIMTLVDTIITPVKATITRLQAIVGSLDLAPIRASIGEITTAARAEIMALGPDALLGAPLASFNALRADIASFDPLKNVLDVLNAVRDAITRLLGKLRLETLLATPLAIYDDLRAEIGKLDPNGLLEPVFVQLDQIASDVDDGLTRTVTEFKRLQEALPSGGGGSTLGVSVDVAVF